MKKSILASAIAISALGSVNANADIAITNMLFGTTNYVSAGSLLEGGGGSMHSIDPFFYRAWFATQATTFMDTTGVFAGSNTQGPWDYSAEIAGLTSNQIAVGIFFNWGGASNIAILEIFDCELSTGACTGNGIAMDNGPFVGSVATFSGVGPVIIPVPAAVWLMGSGLLGLMSVSRRKRIFG